jgi:peroxiredoxin|tara:strand:+ start:83560 stop:84087 length:528 start_codon:yes stop_codon:yes gene_type:complete
MKYSSFLLSILFLVGIACSETSVSEEPPMNQSEPAPDFSYTSLDNEQFTLSEMEGKVVYLFFFGANCPHCRDNGPVTENRIHQAFTDNPNFIAVGLDTWNTSAGSVRNFKSATNITYTLLLNARQSLVDYYGNTSDYDRSVVIAADGTIAYQGTQFVNRDIETVVDLIEEELAKF